MPREGGGTCQVERTGGRYACTGGEKRGSPLTAVCWKKKEGGGLDGEARGGGRGPCPSVKEGKLLSRDQRGKGRDGSGLKGGKEAGRPGTYLRDSLQKERKEGKGLSSWGGKRGPALRSKEKLGRGDRLTAL